MFTAHFQMASSFVKGWVLKKKKKMGLIVFKSRHLVSPRRKHFILPRMRFCSLFCLQRATSPVAQEIGQLRYRLSSKPQSWLLAQILAFSFSFALWKQFCHLSTRQMLPSGTLCLAPKNGIWLHLTHRHLARSPQRGRWRAALPGRPPGPGEAALRLQTAAKLQGRSGKAAGPRLPAPGFHRLSPGSAFVPSLSLLT